MDYWEYDDEFTIFYLGKIMSMIEDYNKSLKEQRKRNVSCGIEVASIKKIKYSNRLLVTFKIKYRKPRISELIFEKIYKYGHRDNPNFQFIQ